MFFALAAIVRLLTVLLRPFSGIFGRRRCHAQRVGHSLHNAAAAVGSAADRLHIGGLSGDDSVDNGILGAIEKLIVIAVALHGNGGNHAAGHLDLHGHDAAIALCAAFVSAVDILSL